MPSKKTTPSADTSSKTLESPAPAASAPAKKRAGKGAKAAPKQEASKPAKPVKQVETEAIQEATSGAPEAASAYPFPPPPEALPWEGPGDALPRRKDQLEINRREREKLADFWAQPKAIPRKPLKLLGLMKRRQKPLAHLRSPCSLANHRKRTHLRRQR